MYTTIKRLIDLAGSIIGMFILFPIFMMIPLFIKLDSKGPVFYTQERVGKNGKIFKIYKFRTMIHNAEKIGPQISKIEDHRITGPGKFLRRYKLDEIPQLINVIKGEMSLVGPRPEVPEYINYFLKDYQEVLKVKPGMTDYASIEFKNENEMLNGIENIEEKYFNEILPVKIEYYKKYVREKSIVKDLGLIFKTMIEIIK